MTVITFDLPNDIQQGLASGQYKQFGGVIRNTASGQVVAMLKEGGNPEALQQLRNISSITNITTILTQGISIYGYALILSKLNEISGKLDKVINYLEIEKMTEFKSGLKLFDKAIQVKNTKNNIYSNFASFSISTIYKSYEFYKDIINKEYYTLYKESKWLNTNNQNKLVEIINIVILSKI